MIGGWQVILALSALLTPAYVFYRRRTANIRAQRDELERLVQARTAELESANRALREASETDALTGLRNRRHLHVHLPADIAGLIRRGRDPEGPQVAFGILVLDIDHFKAINDRYGHVAGDQVLSQVAALLRMSVRDTDYAVRWGGEEFLLIVRDIDRGQLGHIAESIRRSVAEATFSIPFGPPIGLTASLGCVPFPLLPSRPKSLLWHAHVELADAALYWAKHAGRNTWAVCERSAEDFPGMSDELLNGPVLELLGSGAVEIRARDGLTGIPGFA
jgi:diguanylate cyclase (GGDEF)-like protein